MSAVSVVHGMRTWRTWLALCACLLAVDVVVASSSTARSPLPARSAAVIGIVGESDAVNVLHDDFALTGPLVLPAGMPRPVVVALPTSGDFASRLAALRAGPLGSPKAGTLYLVRGTRLLLYSVTGEEDFLGEDRLHATGVISSAIGRRYGTAPRAWAVHIPGVEPAGFDWLATQSAWIDVASTSVYAVRSPNSSEPADTPVCLGARPVRSYIASGRLFFSSSGNTSDQPEAVVSPNGLPEVYQVGGADAAGRTWLPGHVEESDPFYAFGNVVRPYETAELFSFQAASPDALSGGTHFGGTSGATPRTAGRAAVLVDHARAVLGGRASGTALATRAPRAVAPKTGPLADGRLEGGELADVLRRTARPAEAVEGPRYLVEGFGALSETTTRVAQDVLSGKTALPLRPMDEQFHQVSERLRAAAFSGRC